MTNNQQKKPKFINLRTDFGFKKLFFEEPNKDLLISFLNSLFKGRKVIKELTFCKTEFPSDIKSEGNALFDLNCVGENGEQLVIAIQHEKQHNFKERAILHTSRLISSQEPIENQAEWGNHIDEVYLIALLDGFALEGSPENRYLHDIALCNTETGETSYDDLGYIIIELSKFTKEERDLKTDLDKWLFVLKNMNALEKIPVFLRKSIFEKVFKIATYSNLTKEEKMLYDLDLKKQWDEQNALETAKSEGKEEGIKERNEVFVRKLILNFGFTDSQIAEAAEIDIEFVQKVRASIKTE